MKYIYSLCHGHSENILLEKIFTQVKYIKMGKGFNDFVYQSFCPRGNIQNIDILNYENVLKESLKPEVSRLSKDFNSKDDALHIILYLDIFESKNISNDEKEYIKNEKNRIKEKIINIIRNKNIEIKDIFLIYNKKGIEYALNLEYPVSDKVKQIRGYIRDNIELIDDLKSMTALLDNIDKEKSNLYQLNKLIKLL